jgi:hypothetical protein
MLQKKRTKNYPIQQSILYNLKSKNKLAKLFNISLQELKVLQSNDFYSCFQLSGGRNVQHPTDALYTIHKFINKLLSRIELPDYLHSGRKKHSSITNAQSHLFSQLPTLTIDIENFFTSTLSDKVFGFFFYYMKQSPDVANLLTNLLTYQGYIPTGSPVSMNLAFFANIRMFDELYRFSTNRSCKMTVFVDDLTFTGKEINANFLSNIEKIVSKHHLKIKDEKTNFFEPNSPKLITGVVVKNNKIEPEYDQLRKLREDENNYKNDPNNKQNQLVFNGRLAYLSQINKNLKVKMDLKKIS